MKKLLVAYATLSGSTAEVAGVIGATLAGLDGEEGRRFEVNVLPLQQVANLVPYDALVLGAPMIMGWHRSAIHFLKRNRAALQQKPLAIFATAMSLTTAGVEVVQGIPVFVDEFLGKPPRNPERPTLRERYAQVASYAAPILKAAQPKAPVSMAFFAGKLDYTRLSWPALFFVLLAVQAQPGDRRNWQAIRAWATSLLPLLEGTTNASQVG